MPTYKVGEIISQKIVRLDTAGVAVTGKTVANFSFVAKTWIDGAATSTNFTDASTIYEQGSGVYWWNFTAPPGVGYFNITIDTDDTDVLDIEGFEGRTQLNELDDLPGFALTPVVNAIDSVALGAIQSLTLIAHRYRIAIFPIVDQNGDPLDLSGYNNFKFAARDANGGNSMETGDGTYKITGFDCTGDVSGNLTLTMPESVVSATARPSAGAVVLGDVVQADLLTAICIVAGTTAAGAPTWPTVVGTTVTDGTVTWEIQADLWSLVETNIALSEPQRQMVYEITADKAATITQTQPIIRSSPLEVGRFEVGGTYE